MNTSVNQGLKGIPCKLEGCGDIKYMFIPIVAIFLTATIVALVFVGFSIETLVYIVTIVGGTVALIFLLLYLSFKNTYIEIDKNGISGRARRYGVTGFKAFKALLPETFSYQWSEINKISFSAEQMENQIGIELGKETIQYSFSYRLIRYPEFMQAIRDFGGEQLIDPKNIEEIEESYSPQRMALRIIGIIAIVVLLTVFKFFVQ